MKQVLNYKGNVIIEDVPAPKVKEGYVLVSNVCSLISSGTELTSLKSSSESILTKAIKNPELVSMVLDKIKSKGLGSTAEMVKQKLDSISTSPLGYSCAGIVIDKGKYVRDINVGDRVACGGSGYANHAEIVCVPRNLVVRIPENVSFEEAAFTTIGSIAMHGIRRARIEFGETIVVIGLGLIGQLTIQILKAVGCRVVGIDTAKERIDLAETIGVDKGIHSDSPVKEVIAFTDNIGADAVIICASTKSSDLVNNAIKMCRKKGRVVVVGDVGMDIKRETFYEKEIDFLISTSYGPGRYDSLYEEKGIDYPIGYVRWTANRNMQEFLNMVSNGKVNVKSLISYRYPVEQASDAYNNITDKKALGVILTYKEVKKPEHKIVLSSGKKLEKDKINVAVIGCGEFAKAHRLPNLDRIKDYHIRAIIDSNGTEAKWVANKYKADYCGTNYEDVLKDDKIDMILISTRHDSHAKIAIDAANSGKNVFLEKPMALNYEDCINVAKAVIKNKVNFTVGFNRRYAPLSYKLKNFAKGTMPLVVSYRVNAGFLPKEHWTNDPLIGGGRIIGEACHFFDYFNWLIEDSPISINATNISSDSGVIDEDNIITTIKYSDGSMATLNYNTIGNKSMPKERVEVFSGGKSAVLDDFVELTLNDKKEKRSQDKGYYNELVEFAKKIKGQESEILDLNDAIKATILSFKVLDCLKSNEILRLDWSEFYRYTV